MRAALAAVLLLALLGCGGAARCTELLHPACDLDGGAGCTTRQSCVLAGAAVDPCAGGAGACCFDACAADKDCPTNLRCVGGVCVQGRCAPDAGR